MRELDVQAKQSAGDPARRLDQLFGWLLRRGGRPKGDAPARAFLSYIVRAVSVPTVLGGG